MSELTLTRQTIREAPRVIVIRLAGALDDGNGRGADTYLHASIQAEQPRHVLLDLGGLSYANSVFLGSLLSWKAEVAQRGGVLVLFAAQPLVAALIRTVGFHRLIPLTADLETALATLEDNKVAANDKVTR